MIRILAAGVLMMSGLLTMVPSASAEDGGQYYFGRDGRAVSEPTPSTLQP